MICTVLIDEEVASMCNKEGIDLFCVKLDEADCKIATSHGILGTAVHHAMIGLLARGLQADL